MSSLGRREIPGLGPVPSPDGPLVRRTYQFKLVTPMFGGGATAGEVDRHRPIRASSIRGHLRWWWRLLNRPRFTKEGLVDLKAMRATESQIWGSPEMPSPVRVRVQPGQLHNPRKGERFEFAAFSAEAYALFSAIERVPPPPYLVREGFSFTVILEWPTLARRQDLHAIALKRGVSNPETPHPESDLATEIEPAVAAWVQWGGVGARTRRGLGALELTSASMPLPDDVVLPGCRLLLGRDALSKPMDGWNTSVSAYQTFRQSFRGRRHQKGRGLVPGRSHWPEPDSIRRITGCALSSASGSPPGTPVDENPHDHTQAVVTQTQPHFPRAVLGLPIVFHFSDGPREHGSADPLRDPAQVELKPRAHNAAGQPLSDPSGQPLSADRMASPIITKPVKWKGVWKAGILILPADAALKVDCVLVGARALWVQRTGKATDCQVAIPNSQIQGPSLTGLCPPGMTDPLRGFDNAIAAFVAYLGVPRDGGTGQEQKPKPVFDEQREETP